MLMRNKQAEACQCRTRAEEVAGVAEHGRVEYALSQRLAACRVPFVSWRDDSARHFETRLTRIIEY